MSIKLLNAQRDILSPQAVDAVEAALQRNASGASDRNADDAALRKQMENLEKTATKWIKPYPIRGMARECRSFPGGHRRGDGHPHFLSATVQDSDRLHAADALRGDHGGFAVETRIFKCPDSSTRVFDVAVHGDILPRDHRAAGRRSACTLGPLQHVLRFFNQQTLWVQYGGPARRCR